MADFLQIKKLKKERGDNMKLLMKNESTGNDCIFCPVEELGKLGEDIKRECGVKDGAYLLCDIDKDCHVINAYLLTNVQLSGINPSNYKLSGGDITECEIEEKF